MDRPGLPAVLATDPHLEIRTRLAAAFETHLDERAHAFDVEGHEGIVGQQRTIDIDREKATGIVPGQAHRHLCEIVRPEGEELHHAGDVAGDQGRPRHLDHGADAVANAAPSLLHHRLRGRVHEVAQDAELLHSQDEGQHDLGPGAHALVRAVAGRLDDGARLHLVDLRIGDREPRTAVPEHRVELSQGVDLATQLRDGDLEVARECSQIVFAVGQELVKRRIE